MTQKCINLHYLIYINLYFVLFTYINEKKYLKDKIESMPPIFRGRKG